MRTIDNIDYRMAVIRQQRLMNTALTGFISEPDETMIKKIQANNGLEQSGTVDLKTFEALKLYNEERELYASAARLFGRDFKGLSEGGYGQTVQRLNLSLSYIIDGLGLRIRRPHGMFYGRVTSDAVRELRRIFAMPPEVGADARFLCRLKNEEMAIDRRLKK